MRFLVIAKANQDSEAGVMPDEKAFEVVAKYNEELAKAGVLLDVGGLKPSSAGKRIVFDPFYEWADPSMSDETRAPGECIHDVLPKKG